MNIIMIPICYIESGKHSVPATVFCPFIIRRDLSMDFDDFFDEYENDPVASSSDYGLLDNQDGGENNLQHRFSCF